MTVGTCSLAVGARAYEALGPSALAVGVLAVGAFVLGACSGGETPGEAQEVRDSADVRIVRSDRPRWGQGERWTLAASPDLVIGAADGDEAEILHRTGQALRLEGGGILVTQTSGPPRIRVYDGRGEHLRSFGGEGEGPGEFRLLSNACVRGDTVSVYDAAAGRITAFTLEGELVGERPVEGVMSELGVSRDVSAWFDRFGDCDLLGRPNNPSPERPGTVTFPFTRMESADLEIEALVTVTGGPWVAGPEGTRPRPVRFGGFPWAVAGDTVFFVSDDSDFWIEAYSKEGRLLRRFGRDFEPLPITEAEIRRYATHQVESSPAPSRAHLRRTLESVTYADTWPVHTRRMIVDRGGHLWVQHFSRPWVEIEEVAWSVFDPEGIFLGEVSMPAALTVTEIGDDYVLGVWRDPLGVESVRRFTLDRSP